MSVQNGERLATKQDLADMYQSILPYLGGIVTSKAGFTPIGTIISVMGTTAPVNYLACDGTVYNIADYVELANYFNEQFGSKNFFGGNGTTTFAVPDLKGEFLRGTGTNSHENQGNGAGVGEHQDATVVPYIYSSASVATISSAITYNYDKNNVNSGLSRNLASKVSTDTAGSSYSVRPTNTSVLYCIATKNFYIDPTLDYSTEEKIVGTWITGEPIYQKTIETPFTNINAGERKYISIIPNISQIGIDVINAFGFIKLTRGSKHFIPQYLTETFAGVTDNNSAYMTMIIGNNFSLLIKQNFVNEAISGNAYVTIQYTKTTD